MMARRKKKAMASHFLRLSLCHVPPTDILEFFGVVLVESPKPVDTPSSPFFIGPKGVVKRACLTSFTIAITNLSLTIPPSSPFLFQGAHTMTNAQPLTRHPPNLSSQLISMLFHWTRPAVYLHSCRGQQHDMTQALF